LVSASFLTEMTRKRGSAPRTKIEFIAKTGVTTDISHYYLSGGQLAQVRERAPDEIQAGQFDIVLRNDDDTFSEYVATSILYGLDYHGAKIRISEGFLLPDGTLEYEPQGVGFIDQLIADPQVSKVTFRCRDLLWRIMDQKIHARPDAEVVIPGPSNVGDGDFSGLDKKPFVTVNENWTVTCTLGGHDGVATFSVVGSVSGSAGTATSGTEFISLSKGIRFTINEGTVIWVIGDVFTFSTKGHPQWSGLNAGKIIWSILTGYVWDTNTQETFHDLVFDFDRTQSDANTELDYESFSTAIAAIDAIGVFDLKGFAPYDSDAVEFIQSLIVMFLGSLFTGNDGRIKLTTYIPAFTPSYTTFADADKVTLLGYQRSVDEIINYCTVDYIGSDDWPWSSDTVELNGHFVDKNQDSIDKYEKLAQAFTIPWFSHSGDHVQDFTSKLLAKYSEPPLNIDFTTGLDAILTQIGDRVKVTDTKYNFDAIIGEIIQITKQFDSNPASIAIRVRQDATSNQVFGSIGSEVDEGDGESPQSDNYDTATTSDRNFAYAGDESAGGAPDYTMF
jgi:hypothetical protein